jgi:hypothetical protein
MILNIHVGNKAEVCMAVLMIKHSSKSLLHLMSILFLNIHCFPAPHFVTIRSAVLELSHAGGWTGTQRDANQAHIALRCGQ